MKKLTLTAALLMLPSLGFAHDKTVGDLTIIHPNAFETPASARAGAGYLAISNDGEKDDVLLEVRADFPRVMLHESTEVEGVTKMIHLDKIVIPAGDTIVLEPGGLHVMFMGIDGDPLVAGETFPATLVFEHAGEVDVEFKIEARTGHSGHGQNEHNHSN